MTSERPETLGIQYPGRVSRRIKFIFLLFFLLPGNPARVVYKPIKAQNVTVSGTLLNVQMGTFWSFDR